jgi:hypothetical protein
MEQLQIYSSPPQIWEAPSFPVSIRNGIQTLQQKGDLKVS